MKTHRSKPTYRPEPKFRKEKSSHDGFRLKRVDGGWVFVEGKSRHTNLLSQKEAQALNKCVARRKVMQSSKITMHPNYHPDLLCKY